MNEPRWATLSAGKRLWHEILCYSCMCPCGFLLPATRTTPACPMSRFVVLLIVSFALALPSLGQSPCDAVLVSLNCKLLDDFESDTPGSPPSKWRGGEKGGELKRFTQERAMDSQQHVYVRNQNENQFARITTIDQAFRVILPRKTSLEWHLGKRPYLRWRWRAQELPDGANEKYDSKNDTGGAIYVTFDKDWLGRPKSIKYTYSTTVPVGTTVDYGVLKVLVVASKAEQGTEKWVTHERNVVEDYKRLFGDKPDRTPLAVMLWSDSDTMSSKARVDFDDIMVLSGPSLEQNAASSR